MERSATFIFYPQILLAFECNIKKKPHACSVNYIILSCLLSLILSHHASKPRGEIKSVATALKKVPDAFRESHTLLHCDNMHQLHCSVHFVLLRQIAMHDLISQRIDYMAVRQSDSLIFRPQCLKPLQTPSLSVNIFEKFVYCSAFNSITCTQGGQHKKVPLGAAHLSP